MNMISGLRTPYFPARRVLQTTSETALSDPQDSVILSPAATEPAVEQISPDVTVSQATFEEPANWDNPAALFGSGTLAGALDAQGGLDLNRITPEMVEAATPEELRQLAEYLGEEALDNRVITTQGDTAWEASDGGSALSLLARNLLLQDPNGPAFARLFAAAPESLLVENENNDLNRVATDNIEANMGQVLEDMSSRAGGRGALDPADLRGLAEFTEVYLQMHDEEDIQGFLTRFGALADGSLDTPYAQGQVTGALLAGLMQYADDRGGADIWGLIGNAANLVPGGGLVSKSLKLLGAALRNLPPGESLDSEEDVYMLLADTKNAWMADTENLTEDEVTQLCQGLDVGMNANGYAS